MMRLGGLRANRPKCFAIFLLAFGLALPARAALQSDAGVVDIVKPDPVKPDPPPSPAPQADAPKTEAGAAQARPGEPTDPKARKTYTGAIDWEKHKFYNDALEGFRKANKQDGGRCFDCLSRAFALAVKLGAYKDALEIAREMLPLADTDVDRGAVHFMLARSLQEQGIKEKRDQCF